MNGTIHMCYYAVGLIQNLLLRYYKDEEVTDLTEYTLAGQMIQAEAIKDVLDSLRSKMYVCSGTLYWQYNESWGHTGYAPLDYYKLPKASYYYMQRAFSPINVVFSAKGDGIVVYNDSLDETDATVIHGIQDFSGNFICREEKKCVLKAQRRFILKMYLRKKKWILSRVLNSRKFTLKANGLLQTENF